MTVRRFPSQVPLQRASGVPRHGSRPRRRGSGRSASPVGTAEVHLVCCDVVTRLGGTAHSCTRRTRRRGQRRWCARPQRGRVCGNVAAADVSDNSGLLRETGSWEHLSACFTHDHGPSIQALSGIRATAFPEPLERVHAQWCCCLAGPTPCSCGTYERLTISSRTSIRG